MQHTAYGDPIAGIYAAAASLIALHGRARTGGTTIDLSQVECLFQLAADGIIAQSATGAAPPRTGNQRTNAAWRGCLRYEGNDAWIAVEIDDATDLPERLRAAGVDIAAPLPEQLSAPGADVGGIPCRAPLGIQDDPIATALTAWAATRSPGSAAVALLRAGIAAGPVIPAHALLDDPRLLAAGLWRRLQRRFVGAHVLPKPPYSLDGLPPPLIRPAPTLGEHNASVLSAELGIDDAEIAALERDGVIGANPV